MKKAVSLILALVLCLSVCACGAVKGHGSKYVGQYEQKGEITEYYSYYGYNNLVHHIQTKEILTLEGGGVGKYKETATSSGDYYKVGDVIEEGTVRWKTDGEYLTVIFSGVRYNKDYGNNSKKPVDRTQTYELKAGTLHNASYGYLEYTKID